MEKRVAPRIPVNARVRIRAAGTTGPTVPCYVYDSSPAGIGLRCEEAIDGAWTWIEILDASGEPLEEPLQVRVVRTAEDSDGFQEVGCAYD